jgi:toxin-antitoxin system PIN domain toxin
VTRVALLDVHVLVALFDPDHVHHDLAHDWFSDERAGGWATSPLTENGFVRVVGNTARRGEFMPIPEVAAMLRTFRASGHHHFWPDDVSLFDDRVFDVRRVRGHRHVTDVYLLGLAVAHGGRLATFDAGVRLDTVKGATRASLAVITPAH